MSIQSSHYLRVLAESEATDGTDEIDLLMNDSTRDIIYQDVRSGFEIIDNTNMIEAPRGRMSQSGSEHGTIAHQNTISGEIPLASSDQDTNQPYYDAFLKAAGLEETIGTTDTTYTLSTVQQPSATVYLYRRNLEDNNWRVVKSVGTRGNLDINANLNEEVYCTFDGVGNFSQESDAFPAFDADTGTIDNYEPGSTVVARDVDVDEKYANQDPIFASDLTLTWTRSGQPQRTLEVETMTITLGYAMTQVETISGGKGNVRHTLLTRDMSQGNRPQISLALRQGGDVLNDLLAGATGGDTFTFNGLLGNDTTDIDLTVPNMQISPEYSRSDAGGYQGYDVTAFLNGDPDPSSGSLAQDNELTMVFKDPA